MSSDLEARLSSLEKEVRQLTDRDAIRQIISRYGPLVDSTGNEPARLEKVARYFGKDGVYDLGAQHCYTGPEFAASLAGTLHQSLVCAGSTHVMSMPYVVVDGDRATALGYSHVFRNNHDGSFTLFRASANFWEFERKDGFWEITRRTTRLADGSEGPRELLFHVDRESVFSTAAG